MKASGMTWAPSPSRNGRTILGPRIGVPRTPRTLLTVDASAPQEALCDWLRVHGCLNPGQRARELATAGVCRFYRPEDDRVVTVLAAVDLTNPLLEDA